MNIPSHQRQVLLTHAELIRLGVAVRQDRDLAPTLFELLHALEEDGWTALVKGIIDFVEGRTPDPGDLDEEDRLILEAMQQGLSDPDLLAELERASLEQAAAPLAALIYAATLGERDALETVAGLREAADTPTAQATSAALIRMIEGERHAKPLTAGLPEAQVQLIRAVLAELTRLEAG